MVRRISHQRNGVSVHEGHQVFVRQGKIGHVCINYANKLKVRTNDLELFAGEIGQLAGSRQRKDFCPPPPRPPPWATVARGN